MHTADDAHAETIAWDRYYALVVDRNPQSTHAAICDAVGRSLQAFRAQGHRGSGLAAVVTRLLDARREELISAEMKRLTRAALDRGETTRSEDVRAVAVEIVARAHPALYPQVGSHAGAARSAPASKLRTVDPDADLGGAELVRAVAYSLAVDVPDAPRSTLERVAQAQAIVGTDALVRAYRAARTQEPQHVDALVTALRRDAARQGLKAAKARRERETSRSRRGR